MKGIGSSQIVKQRKGRKVKTKIKVPALKIAPICHDLFLAHGKKVFFKFLLLVTDIQTFKFLDRKAIGMIGEAGWERRSDWLWDHMIHCPSNKSQAYKKYESEYDAADLQILAWREYTEGR